MRLTAAEVEKYKLIQDTDRFSVGDLTCLVGKNESGKTAILKALHRLKPDDPDEKHFHYETEYPRHQLFDYEPEHESNPDNVVTTWWDLDDAEAEWFEETFGPKVLTSREVVVKKGYDNTSLWTILADERQAVGNLVARSGLDQADQEKLATVTSLAALVSAVPILDASTRRDEFNARLQELVGDAKEHSVVYIGLKYLSRLMPTFVYYSTYDTMPGEVSLNQLVTLEQQQQLTFKEKIFKALLSLVGVTPADISGTATFESMKARLEAIGLRLTDEIFEYWSQNRDLEVEFTFDAARSGDKPPFNEGYVFRTRIKNKRHGSSVNFNERSTGFVWFFSFLVWFSQMQREHGQNLILLLDEPGLSLHGTAQADLLRYMREKLVPKYQVLYTTHSPFLIDPDDLLSVRTVEDVTDPSGRVLGSKVGDKVLSADAETLFPLRAVLGYDITQTMFIGEHSLLVEGPSDLLYLRWATSELESRGKVGLDRRWTITPCGGIRKVGSFLALFGAHHLHVAVFTDFAHGDKAEVRSLREAGLLRDGHVVTADMFADGQAEADVEDMLGRKFYCSLVNNAYSLPVSQRLKSTRPKDAPERVVKEVEKHFKLLPAAVPEFDHFTPSLHLVEHRGDFASAPGIDAALDRFERLFLTLNSFLD
jgi:energy-coupling factor transporter ATP-binding protein EcfA2